MSEVDPADVVSQRKRQHLEMVTADKAQSGRSPGWNDVHLVPATVPEVSLATVDPTIEFLGKHLQAPLMIASMTGGHEAARVINARLAQAAERLGIAIGSGSQRAALLDPSLAPTYAVLREEAPSAVIVANIGACQLVEQDGRPPLSSSQLQDIVAMVGGDAVAVHLNVVEELIQPEGDRNTAGLVDGLRRLVAVSPVPVIAKETGSGIAGEAAAVLESAGVAALDVGGAGGTSFARVEGMRAAEHGDTRGIRLGATFADWGLPTAISLLETVGAGVPVIATGGIRTGLDAAKALALGADLVGVGRPALVAALQGLDELMTELELLIEELRVAMVLTGSPRVANLLTPPPTLSGDVDEWARQRGLR